MSKLQKVSNIMGRIEMARSLVSVLSAVLVIVTLTLTLGASRSASQKEGFQSINCGGEDYNDSNTELLWKADPFNKKNNEFYGNVSKVNSSLVNIAHVMKTLRFFPNVPKFCYPLQVSNGSTYLLRASFLYGNYDGLNKPPTFVLIFNTDQWTNVTTTLSTTPITHELIFVSKAKDLNVCLAPHNSNNSNHTPFISTLELRLLNKTMYIANDSVDSASGLSQGYGLMLWKRIDYGARTKVALRHPDDPYDRIWESNTTGPIASINPSKVGSNFANDSVEPAAVVMATAITANDSKGTLSFAYEGLGGAGGFRIQMHFEEVDEEAISAGPTRTLTLELPNSNPIFTHELQQLFIPVSAGSPTAIFFDRQVELPYPLQFTLLPAPGYPRGALLNAIELFRWTPQPLSTIATFQGDADAINQIQTYFKLTGYGQGDPCIPKGYTWTWIACNQDIQPRITEINLASFNLTGDIPSFINLLSNLQRINFSNNMLTGEIPNVNLLLELEELDLHHNQLYGELPPSLSSLPKLAKLDVSENNLCGSSPSFQISINYKYFNNTRLCDPGVECHCNSSSSSESSMPPTLVKKSHNIRKYIFSISFLGALHLVSFFTLLAIYKSRRSGSKLEKSTSTATTNRKGVDDPQQIPLITKMFTYNEISNATLNFTTILGEGGFGKVYHGLLPTGEAIAVKMLADASKQGLKEFYNEVEILSRVRHKNLVSLIGYCVENKYMLIYEYIAKGNLRDLIYGDKDSTDKPLPWITRLHIALGASQGLEYLHKGCDPTIVHRDVKSSNILLNDKMQAKVADFGLSRLKEANTTTSHVSIINVVGTAGYLDPAYNSTNQLTDQSDVYSFGIVLFELICGRPPIDMFTSPTHIVDWAISSVMQGKVQDIVDPMLANGYQVESMWKALNVAFGCVESDRMKRPKMSQVSQLLQNAVEIEINQNSLQDGNGSSSMLDGKLPTLPYIENFHPSIN